MGALRIKLTRVGTGTVLAQVNAEVDGRFDGRFDGQLRLLAGTS